MATRAAGPGRRRDPRGPGTVAADRRLQRVDLLRLGGIAAENREILLELDPGDRRGARTLGAESPDEALRDDELDGRRDEEGFDAHVDQTGDGAGRVVRVQRGKDQVSRQ